MNRQPLEGFQMHNVREDRRQPLIEQAIELWLAQNVLTAEQAGKRAEELLFVAVDEHNGGIAGVCTTYLRTPPKLKMPLWHFRTFVAPEYRQNNVAFHLLHLAIDFHESSFASGSDTSGRGLYMEIENPVIQRHRNEAVWPSSGMVFVGFNARGDHCRVRYFPGARI
ncbi:MAG TPA: hypothetical protein VJ902_02200 [Wenzhouxiangellaceae bacterium]|nr:hypothetical protein [Wenzhouxiangellaceae bacterium]